MTGDKLGSTLANQDAARGYKFSAKTFDAQPLADAVTPVTDASLTFLVCHKNCY
jgi:hypothetical protein